MRLIDGDALKLDIVEEGQKSKRYKIGEFWELNMDEIWKVIDRQQTIEPVHGTGYRDGYKRGKKVGYKKGRERRKTGRWIYEEDGIIHGHCSCCWFRAIYQETDVFGYDFCPNCGARMEEGEG